MKERIHYIEWLRIISALAVIGIHITMTQPNNYSVQEIGSGNYIILTSIYALIQWAVPVFLMISGNLLLHSAKITPEKVKNMIVRMSIVLILFGSAFALMEQVFEKKTIELVMLPNSVLMTLQQESWSHLWYIYVLIGIYLILIPLKKFVDNSGNKEICVFAAVLIVGNFIVPTINIAFGTKIENYMLLTQYVTFFLLGYIVGGLRDEGNNSVKNVIADLSNQGGVWLGLWIFASAIKVVMQYISVTKYGEGSALVLGDRVFTLIQAVAIYCIFKKFLKSVKPGKVAHQISKCSFGIYLIHPLYINLIYKLLKITPTNFGVLNTFFSIFVLWFLVSCLSFLTAMILLRLPILKKYL